MTLSYAIDVKSSPNTPPFQHLNQQVNALRKRSRARDAFDTLERELHEVFAEAERTCLDEYMDIFG